MPAFSGMRSDPVRLERTVGRWSRRVSLIAFPVGALTVVMSADLTGSCMGRSGGRGARAIGAGRLRLLFVVTLLLSNLLVGIG